MTNEKIGDLLLQILERMDRFEERMDRQERYIRAIAGKLLAPEELAEIEAEASKEKVAV